MSNIKISSTGWLAICLRNSSVGLFDLNDINSWQYLPINQTKDEDDFNRNLIKFSPNGEFFVVNGENKQLFIYIRCDFEKTEVWWRLQRIVFLKKSLSALDLTNEILFITDIIGDIYKINLLSNDENITEENRIMKHSSMILDMNFIRINDKKSFILIADQDEKIYLNSYPNISQNVGLCLGHTEFVTHVRLIDSNHIISASGDGTIRLWRFPDCTPLVLFHSKAFVLSTKQIFYTQLYHSDNYSLLGDYQIDSMPHESLLDTSLPINYSIWKMDIASYGLINSNVYIAFSIYAHRFHSIYLTNLTNLKQLDNEQRKLIFDSTYGTIIDYCFPSKDCLYDDYHENAQIYLYILFDSNVLLKIDVISILLCDETELFVKSDENTQEINNILARKEFQLNNFMNNNTSYDILFQQLFKNHPNSKENSLHKRKSEKVEQQQPKKRPAPSLSDESISFDEES